MDRTSSVWFLVARTIVVFTRPDCGTTEEPWAIPLPAPKTQWEARSEESWLRELSVELPVLTTFGHLIESKKRRSEPNHAQNLNTWNATSDHLGSLLNLAVNIVSDLPSERPFTI